MTKKKTQKKATKLTAEEGAKIFKKQDTHWLYLSHITELDFGAAEALAKFKGSQLRLNGL